MIAICNCGWLCCGFISNVPYRVGPKMRARFEGLISLMWEFSAILARWKQRYFRVKYFTSGKSWNSVSTKLWIQYLIVRRQFFFFLELDSPFINNDVDILPVFLSLKKWLLKCKRQTGDRRTASSERSFLLPSPPIKQTVILPHPLWQTFSK